MEASERGGEKDPKGLGSVISDAELATMSDVESDEAKTASHERSNG